MPVPGGARGPQRSLLSLSEVPLPLRLGEGLGHPPSSFRNHPPRPRLPGAQRTARGLLEFQQPLLCLQWVCTRSPAPSPHPSPSTCPPARRGPWGPSGKQSGWGERGLTRSAPSSDPPQQTPAEPVSSPGPASGCRQHPEGWEARGLRGAPRPSPRGPRSLGPVLGQAGWRTRSPPRDCTLPGPAASGAQALTQIRRTFRLPWPIDSGPCHRLPLTLSWRLIAADH